MLIVGELINASRKEVAEQIRTRNREAIQKIAVAQVAHGAAVIDVNAGTFVGEEPECLKWLVETVQAAVAAPCCIDSPDPAAVAAALSVHRGPAMVNSISLEKNRYEPFLSIMAGSDHRVVALCMSDDGVPETLSGRLAVADTLINGLVRNRVNLDNIYVDALVQPIATESQSGKMFLEAVKHIMERYQGVHSICGLSNISYGLPVRRLLNWTYAAMAVVSGLDAVIGNPLDRRLMSVLISANTLAGHDAFCADYLHAYRENRLEA